MFDQSGTNPLDIEVRQLIAAGRQREATDLMLTRLSPELRPFLHRLLGDASLVDEALSNTCEHLWQRLAQFRWEYSLRSWSYIFARREASRCRAARSRMVAPPTMLSAADGRTVYATPSAGRSTSAPNLLHLLHASISDDDRDLLVLRVERGLSWREVAAAFLEDDEPSAEAIQRESARLRQRYRAIRVRLAAALAEDHEKSRGSSSRQ
jgi:RNA polymerase sigma-70 factor (ECF subfamily)